MTCCASTERRAAPWLAAALAASLAAAPAAAAKKSWDPDDLFNPLLGVEHSHWLVGPIHRMASESEIEEYLTLTDDAAASRFIEEFWARRNEGTGFFKKTPQQIFDERAETANNRYSEGTVPGRLTDRGAIYVIYGEPEETSFESPRERDGPPIELWEYPKGAAPGLDGEKPKREYRFLEVDGRTVLFSGGAHAKAKRKRQRERERRGF